MTVTAQSEPEAESRRQEIAPPDVDEIIAAARESVMKEEETRNVLKSVSYVRSIFLTLIATFYCYMLI